MKNSPKISEKLGAKIVKVPSYVAKHPFRVTVSVNLAVKAKGFYEELQKEESDD